jgi:hypothetical protein
MKTLQSPNLHSIIRNPLGNYPRRWVVVALTLLLAFTSLAWISPAHPKLEPTRTGSHHSTIKYAVSTPVPGRTTRPTPAYYLNTGTPLPPDWVNNVDQTNSIIFGAIILVLIVLVGTLTSVRARKSPK